MNNTAIVAGTAIAVTCVGVTILDKIKKNKLERERLAEENKARFAHLRDMLLDMKANVIAYDEINERIKRGYYLHNSEQMLADYTQLYEFEKIAVRIED